MRNWWVETDQKFEITLQIYTNGQNFWSIEVILLDILQQNTAYRKGVITRSRKHP